MRSIVKKMWCCGAKSIRGSEPELGSIPEGHVRVYVGKDEDILCKFEMEVNFLNHPLFESLLRLSEEEFGYSYEGALRIACETDLFLYLLNLLATRNPTAHYMEVSDLMSNFSNTKAGSHRIERSNEVCGVTTFGQLLAEHR